MRQKLSSVSLEIEQLPETDVGLRRGLGLQLAELGAEVQRLHSKPAESGAPREASSLEMASAKTTTCQESIAQTALDSWMRAQHMSVLDAAKQNWHEQHTRLGEHDQSQGGYTRQQSVFAQMA